MRKESKYPGYFVNFDGDDVWLERRNKRLCKHLDGNRVYWKVFVSKGVQRSILAEDLIVDTFPELERKDYIPALYKDMKSVYNGRTKTFTIAPGVKLTLIYSYLLETPIDMDLSEAMKTMFPGHHIVVEEGNEVRRWREIYFRSDLHMMVVAEKIKDFLEKN